MKKTELRSFILFFISVLILITACIKNNSDVLYYNGEFSIVTAKKWYEENKTQFDQMARIKDPNTGQFMFKGSKCP